MHAVKHSQGIGKIKDKDSVTRTKSPKVYKSCPKMISPKNDRL